MKQKKKTIFGITLSVFLFIHLLIYNPFTPIGAIRWTVFLYGFVIEPYTLTAEIIPRSEISIGSLSAADFTKDQTVYYITSHSLRDKLIGTEARYWKVTDKRNGLYHAQFTGY